MIKQGKKHQKSIFWPLVSGLVVGIISLVLTVSLASAAPTLQTEGDEVAPDVEILDSQSCQECHLDVSNHWSESPHAHAYDDPYFQERWEALGEPGECLFCHTTNYQPAIGEFDEEGIACDACHGEVTAAHPPEPVPVKADTEYCGTCHTTTLGEWRQTGHATADVGCNDCHDPHSQRPLFEVADDMCINCHQDSMERYLEDLHVTKGIGCVDCHALVIPPDPIPDDGIVPTGHAFNITPATCVACHTDALHAGFSLPGWEQGALVANGNGGSTDELPSVVEQSIAEEETAEGQLSLEQQVQAMEAALASQNVTLIFQGGIVGLVLGGTTAWFVSQNIRANKREE
ncbi:MAG: hypothetical protein H6660_06205 [Ardenticatenaceae bacterium]|nr:hypothetical protein [Ardenticatenaceae bacterium]